MLPIPLHRKKGICGFTCFFPGFFSCFFVSLSNTAGLCLDALPLPKLSQCFQPSGEQHGGTVRHDASCSRYIPGFNSAVATLLTGWHVSPNATAACVGVPSLPGFFFLRKGGEACFSPDRITNPIMWQAA